jgi:tRNA pseudouridine55 synthase
LGRHSPTEDIDGEVTELANPPIPTREQIEQAAASMTGEILQRPPAFSALKQQGRRAYDLARAGQTVELAPRPITVHSLQVRDYDYPRLALTIECGSGTYVRSLGRDLAIHCGTQAVMCQLVRTAIGHFTLAEAATVETLRRDGVAPHLTCAAEGLRHLPRAAITAEDLRRLAHGQAIETDLPADISVAAAVDPSGELCALLQPRDGRWHPFRSFSRSVVESRT